MRFLLACFGVLLVCCTGGCGTLDRAGGAESAILIAHLGRADGDPEGLQAIRNAFGRSNVGYDVAYFGRTNHIQTASTYRIVFVQEETAGLRTLPGRVDDHVSEIGGGDIILLPPHSALIAQDNLDFLVFETPEPFPDGLPTFIRPDWDEKITDTPGGCATETGAYRRILLTWMEPNGPYIYHALNAHRVRITDSFSHYHPVNGGFDEFYFVQMVQANGRIIVSNKTDRIEDPAGVTRDVAAHLLQTHDLEVGDLVYIPRGVVHRGVGGVLAQVITVPGFRPGAEIGVDHHLRAINENLSLLGDEALPYNKAASTNAIVK